MYTPDEIAPEELARATVERYVLSLEILAPPLVPRGILARRAGVFTTIKTEVGQLRGCVGTFLPTCDSIAGEIIRNAIKAACEDPRFRPIRRGELGDLRYSVDVLSPPEPVQDVSQLDAAHYGIIIHSESGRRALLLPAIEGIDSAEVQLSTARRKAGIAPAALISIERFTVQRFGVK